MPDAFATNSTIQAHWKNAWFAAQVRIIVQRQIGSARGIAYDQTLLPI